MPNLSFYLTVAQSCKDQDILFISVPQVDQDKIISHLIQHGFNARPALIELPGWHSVLIEIVYFEDEGGGGVLREPVNKS